MSLTLALNNALSGLNVSQRSLSVLSNNVANANTPGYSRQEVQLASQVAGGHGAGVRIEQVVRKIDEYLHRAVQGQNSKVGQTEIVSDYMSRIQVMMGEPGGSNSLDEYVENFFNVLQSLAETPELTSHRSQAVNAGVILARELSSLAEGLEDLRYQADADIRDGLDVVNTEIMRLYETNQAIYRAQALGESIANLEDQRDLSIKTISEFVDVKVNTLDSGEVYLYTQSGSALLEYMPYQFQYNSVNSLTTFTTDSRLGSITLDAMKPDGSFIGRPETVVTSGINHDITTTLVSGKLKGLLDLRDNKIPNMLDQLDQIAAVMRDEMNAIHNSGSGVPAASLLTGDRAVSYEDASEWTGAARIAVLNEDGTAVNSRYGNTDTGYLALDLDFDAMRAQYGGLLTTQNILDEINAHFQPQNKAAVGNMQNIGLAAISNNIPDTGNTFNFDLELENISDTNSNVWLTDLQVLDDSSAVIDTQNLAAGNTVTVNATNTFETSVGSTSVTVNATGHGFQNGDVVYLNGISGNVNGIPMAELNGQAFRITNVTAGSFTIEVATAATSATPPAFDMGGITALPADATQTPGIKSRTGGSGYTVDLSGAPASAFYTVRASVMVEDEEGNLSLSTIDYRVDNLQSDIINERYAARSATGAGSVEVPTSHRPLMVAQLVNENGNIAAEGEKGYLQLVAQSASGGAAEKYTIAIDDLNSSQIGRPNESPVVKGTNRGFSHYFGLNNFFKSNDLTGTGDTVAGSALAMTVRQDIVDNPNLISMGTLSRTPSTAAGVEDWSYERSTGENSVAQRLAKLGLDQLSFTAAGGLPSSSKTFNGYASEVLGYTASQAAAATAQASDEQTLLDGFQSQVDAVSGVNIDEEMANTIIFQNAYAASAQVINTVKELFDTLLATF